MSRSYRRPYASVCGNASAKQDKRIAARGVRRAQNRIVSLLEKDPESDRILPHFRECPWNDVYSWGRDGKQNWQYPDGRDWSRHWMAVNKVGDYAMPYLADLYADWPPKWFAKLIRK